MVFRTPGFATMRSKATNVRKRKPTQASVEPPYYPRVTSPSVTAPPVRRLRSTAHQDLAPVQGNDLSRGNTPLKLTKLLGSGTISGPDPNASVDAAAEKSVEDLLEVAIAPQPPIASGSVQALSSHVPASLPVTNLMVSSNPSVRSSSSKPWSSAQATKRATKNVRWDDDHSVDAYEDLDYEEQDSSHSTKPYEPDNVSDEFESEPEPESDLSMQLLSPPSMQQHIRAPAGRPINATKPKAGPKKTSKAAAVIANKGNVLCAA